MRKIINLFLLLSILVGCASEVQSYDAVVDKAMRRPLVHSVSRTKDFLKYYVLPDVGVSDTTEISSVFDIEGFPIVMSLNVSDIVSRQYYGSATFKSKLNREGVLYKKNGTYVDRNGKLISYAFTVLEDGANHVLVLENNIVTLMGVITPVLAQRVVDSMFVTLRSVEANEQEIASKYSNKVIVDYKAVHEEFFNHKIPESGTLYDIYNQLHPNDAIIIEDDTNLTEDTNQEGGL